LLVSRLSSHTVAEIRARVASPPTTSAAASLTASSLGWTLSRASSAQQARFQAPQALPPRHQLRQRQAAAAECRIELLAQAAAPRPPDPPLAGFGDLPRAGAEFW